MTLCSILVASGHTAGRWVTRGIALAGTVPVSPSYSRFSYCYPSDYLRNASPRLHTSSRCLRHERTH